MQNKTKLHKAITSACLLLSSGGLVFSIGPLAAEEDVEKITVTGSLIRSSAAFSENSPVEVVERDQFTAFAADTVVDIAKNLTVSGGAEFQNETGSLIGTSQFNIRGLGLGSSLTLINGRRGGVSAVADGGGNQFFDINQLPLAMIKRIDILTDGASATYGSQAVAGVANIITRKGFEGFEISGKYQDASNRSQTINLAAGANSDKASFNIYATYRTNTRNDRTDFDWLTERLDHTGDLSDSRLISSTGAPGSYRIADVDENGNYLGSRGGTVADFDCIAAGGIKRSATDSRCRHDFADQVSVIPENNVFQVFSEGEYDVSDSVKVFIEGSFSRSRVERTQGPSLFDNGLANGNVLIPADHPFNFYVEGVDEDGDAIPVYIGPESWDNSIHTATALRGILRPLGAGFNGGVENRHIDIDYWRGVVGTNIDFTDDWSMTLSYMYAASRRTDEQAYEFVADTINDFGARAINTFGIDDDIWNPFGTAIANPTLVSPKDGTSVAGNSDELLRALWRTSRDEQEATQSVIDVIVTGFWGELDGGDIGWAFGYQRRYEDLLSIQDSLSASGSGARNRSFDIFPIISGEQTVNSYFAEAQLPFNDDFELQLALRHESFDSGLSTTDPKIAGRWQVSDEFALRGSYGTSFQAPSVRQQSTASQSAFIDDPASINPITGQLECVDRGISTNATVVNEGNPDLQPQSADSIALGLVFQPEDNLNLSLDYWRFDYEDLITPDEGGQAIINNDCLDDGVANDPRIVRDPGGVIRQVTSAFINAGSVITDGIDLSMDYNFTLGEAGDLRVGMKATYVNSFDIKLSDDSETIDAVGSRNFLNPFRPTPELRGNLSFNWSLDQHKANMFVRYIDSYVNDNNSNDDNLVPSWTTIDAQYSYSISNLFGENSETTISIGANNLLDRDPPSLGERQRPGYETTIHDVRGRQAYLRFKQSF